MLVWLFFAWLLIGLAWVLSVPYGKMAFEDFIEERSGFEFTSSQLSGYFYIYRFGIRLDSIQLSDEKGPILTEGDLVIDVDPLTQWLSGNPSPLRVSIIGTTFRLDLLDARTVRIQDRFTFQFAEAVGIPPADSPPTQEADSIIHRFNQDLNRQLIESMSILDTFTGWIGLENCDLVIHLIPTREIRLVTNISIALRGGGRPKTIVSIPAANHYSRNIQLELTLNQPFEGNPRIDYQFLAQGLNANMFEDFFTGNKDIGLVNADINANGFWSLRGQSHDVLLSITETFQTDGKILSENALDLALLFESEDRFLRAEIPYLYFNHTGPDDPPQLQLEHMAYTSHYDDQRLADLNFGLSRFRIDRETSLALLLLKNRLFPQALPTLDEMIANISVQDLEISVDPERQAIDVAEGLLQINFLQLQKGTYFSNVEITFAENRGEGVVRLDAVGSDLAILDIVDRINVHRIENARIQLVRPKKNWQLKVGCDSVELVPDQVLTMDLSVEFQPDYSPWIYLDFRMAEINTNIAKIYMPHPVLNPKLDQWVWEAIQGGIIKNGRVEYGGNIYLALPEIYPEIFTLDLELNGVELRYNPNWPAITRVNGMVRVKDSKLTFDLDGRFGQSQISATSEIENFNQPVLNMNATSHGGYRDLRRFLLASPLIDRVGPFLDLTTGAGTISSDNKITVELFDDYRALYSGVAELKLTKLELNALNLHFRDVIGGLTYNQNGISSERIEARLNGLPFLTRIETKDYFGDTRVGVEILTEQNIIDVVHAEAILDGLGAKGQSLWYARFLTPAILADDDLKPSGPIPADRSLFYLYSDLQGVAIAQNTSIVKSEQAKMPLSIAFVSKTGDVWPNSIRLDQTIQALTRLDFSREENPVAAARIRLSQAEDNINPPPTVALESLLEIDDSKITNARWDEMAVSQTLARDALAGWRRVVDIDPEWSIEDGLVLIEGRLGRLKAKPWMVALDLIPKPPKSDEIERDPPPLGPSKSKVDRLSYRFDLSIAEVDIYGLPLNNAQIEAVLAEDALGMSANSDETQFEMTFDFSGRPKLAIEIESLDYRLPEKFSRMVKDVAANDVAAVMADGSSAEPASSKQIPESTPADLATATGAADFAVDSEIVGENSGKTNERDKPASPLARRKILGYKKGGKLLGRPPPTRPSQPVATTAPSVLAESESASVEVAADSEASTADIGLEPEFSSAEVEPDAPTPSTPIIATPIIADPEIGSTEVEADLEKTAATVEPDSQTPSTKTEEQTGALDEIKPDAQRKLYDFLSGFERITINCRLCAIDNITLHRFAAELTTRPTQVSLRIDYGNDKINENLSLSLDWNRPDKQTMRSELEVRLTSRDLARSIRGLGYQASVGALDAQIELIAGWDDAPLNPDYPSFNGSIAFDLRNGVIYDIGSSSALRLLSILNLLEIPRRISLDFTDLGENTEFLKANVDADIIDGVVIIDKNQPLRMRSSLGELDVVGKIDLNRAHFNVGGHLVPTAVTFTAPVVALLLAGPVAGVGVVSLNWILNLLGVDANSIAEQYAIIDSPFDRQNIQSVNRPDFLKWRNSTYLPESGDVEPESIPPNAVEINLDPRHEQVTEIPDQL